MRQVDSLRRGTSDHPRNKQTWLLNIVLYSARCPGGPRFDVTTIPWLLVCWMMNAMRRSTRYLLIPRLAIIGLAGDQGEIGTLDRISTSPRSHETLTHGSRTNERNPKSNVPSTSWSLLSSSPFGPPIRCNCPSYQDSLRIQPGALNFISRPIAA